MGINGLKVQIAVLLQLQIALHDPSQGTRVLYSKIIYFLTNKSKPQTLILH